MKIRLAVDAPTLTAAEDRTITGLLLPFGEVGYPHGARRLIARAGTLLAPVSPDLVELNDEHTDGRLGHALALDETPDGIRASFAVDPGPAGDTILADVRDHKVTGLSVEIDGAVIDAAGHLDAGIITGAATVTRPAFNSARITANHQDKEKSMTPEEIAALKSDIINALREEPDVTPDVIDDVEDVIDDIADEHEHEAPAIAAARRAARAHKPGAAPKVTARDLYRALAGAAHGGRAQIAAALADIVPANTLGIHQPAYVGELWNGKAYERQIIPAFNHADLTSMKVQGWEWVTRPGVGEWEGNKTAIPSGSIKTKSVEVGVERIAGGHDIDRIYRDFNESEFWEAYYTAMTESYAQLSDTKALAAIKAKAKEITLGTVPAGVTPGLVAVIDGALAILSATNTMPDHAFIAPGLYRDMALTRMEDSLAYLSASLGLEDGTLANFQMKPRADLAAGEVLVTAKNAVTIHELGGGAPIRVEAIDVGKGGIDAAVFGYQAHNVHSAAGLALVTVA